MKITGHKKLLTLQRYVKSGTDIDQMYEIGKKIRNGYFYLNLITTKEILKT
jgi:hypothetical protein